MKEQRAHGIATIATKYGLIQGVLSFIWFLVRKLIVPKQNWVGIGVSTLILIALMILAHREFKRTHESTMTYPQGLGSGTLLSSVGALVTCIVTYVYLKYINTGYIAAAMEAQRAAIERRGISGPQAEMAMGMMGAITSPIGIAFTSLITSVIVGFIVALIVSIFTEKRDPNAGY